MKSSILLAAIILLHPPRTNAQPAEQGWGKFGFLIGTWIGEGFWCARIARHTRPMRTKGHVIYYAIGYPADGKIIS